MNQQETEEFSFDHSAFFVGLNIPPANDHAFNALSGAPVCAAALTAAFFAF